MTASVSNVKNLSLFTPITYEGKAPSMGLFLVTVVDDLFWWNLSGTKAQIHPENYDNGHYVANLVEKQQSWIVVVLKITVCAAATFLTCGFFLVSKPLLRSCYTFSIVELTAKEIKQSKENLKEFKQAILDGDCEKVKDLYETSIKKLVNYEDMFGKKPLETTFDLCKGSKNQNTLKALKTFLNLDPTLIEQQFKNGSNIFENALYEQATGIIEILDEVTNGAILEESIITLKDNSAPVVQTPLEKIFCMEANSSSRNSYYVDTVRCLLQLISKHPSQKLRDATIEFLKSNIQLSLANDWNCINREHHLKDNPDQRLTDVPYEFLFAVTEDLKAPGFSQKELFEDWRTFSGNDAYAFFNRMFNQENYNNPNGDNLITLDAINDFFKYYSGLIDGRFAATSQKQILDAAKKIRVKLTQGITKATPAATEQANAQMEEEGIPTHERGVREAKIAAILAPLNNLSQEFAKMIEDIKNSKAFKDLPEIEAVSA